MQSLTTRYHQAFGQAPACKVRVTGRVNLVGEHTDYNGGYVLPVAIPRYLSVAGRLVDEHPGILTVASAQYPDKVVRVIDSSPSGHWSDYVIAGLQQVSMPPAQGLELYIDSDIPKGTGVSSSAALMVAVIKLAKNLTGQKIDDLSVAKKARQGENGYIGVPCGIMDQLTVSVGKVARPILLNCATLDYTEYSSLPEHQIVVMNSGIERRLVDGIYAKRRAECEAARMKLNIPHLAKASLGDLHLFKDEDTLYCRAKHIISDSARAQKAAIALEYGDAGLLGNLFYNSHISQRDDFDISVPEMDQMVEVAMNQGALGARQTGGGFGGCMLALLPKEKTDDWTDRMLGKFPDSVHVTTL